MDRNDRDDDLLMGALDGQLSDDDLRMLAGRLKEEPDLARRMMELARDESLLAEVLAKPDAQASSVSAARPRPDRTRPARVRWGTWISVAACLTIIVGALVYNARQEERFVDVMVARIRKTSADVKILRAADGRAVVAVVGMELFAGDRIETKKGSQVVIGYPNEKTTITAGGAGKDTAVRIGDTKDGKRLHLEKGVLDASVAPQPEGRHMVVTTERAKAEVVGTRFRLWDDGRMTWLEVTEGEVLLTRTPDGEAVSVGAGRLAAAGPGTPPKAYPSDAEWVDGPVLFEDDFEKPRAQWECRIQRAGTEQSVPYPEGLKRCFTRCRLGNGSRAGSLLHVTCKGKGFERGDTVYLVPVIARAEDADGIVYEYDVHFAGREGTTITESIDPSVRYQSGRWYRVRRELVRLPDDGEGPRWRRGVSLDGRLQGTLEVRGRMAGMFGTSYMEGRSVDRLIDNVVVRELVRVER
jgi:ferric-dicitrate binding protein FerR (iron transport regulator)